MKRKVCVLFIFMAIFIIALPPTVFADIGGFGDGNNNYTDGDKVPSKGTKNYSSSYTYNFSTNDKERISKGDLQVRVVMDVKDTDRGTFWNADDVEFKIVDNLGNQYYRRFEDNYDPGDSYSYVWDTGKKTINNSATSITLNFYVYADGDNDGGFMNIKLYFYDINQPDIKEINSSDLGLKMIGNTVNIQVVFDEAVNVTGTPRINMNTGGYAYYDSGSGTNILTFKYTVGEGEQTEALNYHTNPGNIDLNSGTIKDPAGNAAKLSFINKTNNLVNKNIKVDGKKSSIASIVTVITNNKKDSNGQPLKQLNAGDTVTMTVKFDEPVNVSGTASSINLKLNNESYAIAQSVGNGITQLNFKYTVGSNDKDVTTLDIVEFLGGTIKDTAGNEIIRNVKSIAISGIRIDNTPPTVSFSPDGGTIYRKSHSTKVTIADSSLMLSGQTYKYSWSTDSDINKVDWAKVTDSNPCTEVRDVVKSGVTGKYYLHIRAEDVAGNYGYKTSKVFYLDNEGPNIVLEPSGSTSPKGDYNVKVTINDTDLDSSSLQYQWYKGSVDNNKWASFTVSNGVGYISAIGKGISDSISDHGNWKLAIKASDTLKNETIRYSEDFLIDKVPPIIEISPNSSISDDYKRSHSITLSATDDNYYLKDYANGSISGRWYQWRDSSAAPRLDDDNWELYDGSFIQEEYNGSKWLHVKVKDNSGNISTKHQLFNFDNQGPSITFLTNGSEMIQGSVTAEITLSDELSGLSGWYYQWSNSETANDYNWLPTSSFNIPLSNADGNWYLSIKAIDNAGNESIATSKRFRLDNMPPTGSIDIVEKSTNINVVDINLTAVDTNNPDELQYRISTDEGLTWSQWKTFVSRLDNVVIPDIEGTRKVQVQYKDKFNNESVIFEDSVIIDKMPPTAEIRYSTDDQWIADDVIVILGGIGDSHREGEEIIERDPKEVSIVNGNEAIIYDELNHEYMYTFKDNGRTSFTIRDQAGNQTVINSLVNWIDKSSPAIVITTNGNNNSAQTVSTAVYLEDTVEFEGEVLKTENPESYYYQWNKSATSPAINDPSWEEASNGDQVYLKDVDGEWYFHVKAFDSLGNTKVLRSNKFVLDNTPPYSTITYSNTNRTANPVTAYIEFDEFTTITSTPNGNNSHTFVDNGEFAFEFVDRAGNVGFDTAYVGWIDKSLPTVDIVYSTTSLTNENVTVSISVYGEPKRELIDFEFPSNLDYIQLDSEEDIDGTVVGTTIEIIENGSFSFTVRDCTTGISDTVKIVINNIDKIKPKGEVIYSETEKTKNNIEVTIMARDNTNQTVTVLPPHEAILKETNGNTIYVFTKNGQYDFELWDIAGNKTVLTAVIDNIDREAPIGEVEYTPDTWTKEKVIAKVQANEQIKVLNNNGNTEYSFYDNGTFTFMIEDKAGNRSQILAEVDWIDKIPPTGVLKYDANNRTNQDVEVVIEASDNSDEKVQVIPPEGVMVISLDETTRYMITENGNYQFKLVDLAGNEEILTASINNIDKILPTAEINYSIMSPTNKTVELRLTLSEEGSVIPPEGIIVKKDKDSTIYEVIENGEYAFTLIDMAENTNTVTASVLNIDRKPPSGSVTYSTDRITRGPVIATVNADEEFYVANNFNSRERVFAENGTYIFSIMDLAGNISEVKAEVTNIDNEPPKVSIAYSTKEYTNGNVIATIVSNEDINVLNNNGSSSFEFKSNGTFKFIVADQLGNETSVSASVNNIDKKPPVITFNSDYRPIFKVNEEYDLNDFTAYDSIDGDLTSSVIIDKNGFNIGKAGQYQIIYSITDRAGNITTMSRDVMVISPDSYRVFINGLDSSIDPMIFDTSKLNITIMNQKGNAEVKWKSGYLNQGSMKAMANSIEKIKNVDTGEQVYVFKAPSTGHYTLYIQDQERNTIHIQVFIKSLSSQEVQ
ncbi:MAG: immunoglobulin-like domain-containing protein [Tissierellales bacterium]